MGWQNEQIVIDGDLTEWGDLPRFYDSKAKLFYEFRNDDENIFLSFYSNDRITNLKIIESGLELFVDTLKIKDNSNQIICGISKNPKRPNFYKLESQITINGFSRISTEAIASTAQPNSDSLFILALNCFGDSLMSGELKIPIKTFYKDRIVAKDTLTTLFFAIKLNELALQERFGNAGNQKMNPDEIKGFNTDSNVNMQDQADYRSRSQDSNFGGTTSAHPMGGPASEVSVEQLGEKNIKLSYRFSFK